MKQKENLDIKTLEKMHETLEKVLIKWMKTIRKTIKNDEFSEYDMKPDRPSNKSKSNKKAKKKDNPETKKKDKPDTKKKDKPDTKKKDKPDTKKKDKPDIEKHRSKLLTFRNDLQIQTLKSKLQKTNEQQKTNEPQKNNEPPKIFNKGEPTKTFNSMKKILECFVCEKFRNEKFRTARLGRDMISLQSIYKPMRGFKRIHRIGIYRDMISSNTEKQTKSMKQDNIICIEGERIILKVSQTEDYYRIK